MFYERKIKYLDYIVNDIRNGNGGFCKLEARDSICNMTIQVNGLRVTDSMRCPVYLREVGQEKELCSLELLQGRGSVQMRGLKISNLDDTGISYERLEGIRIPISPEREIRCVLRETKVQTTGIENSKTRTVASLDVHDMEIQRYEEFKAVKVEPDDVEREPDEVVKNLSWDNQGVMSEDDNEISCGVCIDEMNVSELVLGENESCNVGSSYMDKTEIENIRKNVKENEDGYTKGYKKEDEEYRKEDEEEYRKGNVEKNIEEDIQEEEKSNGKMHRIPLRENKWEQLWAIYPHIVPFRDEREYLTISPSDFVLLPSRYFRLANNSFLLHGYYNYNHLVLRRMESRGEERYYIGVPGTFFDREKQVAVMFGFESFECMEEPAQTGDYGYYMMRIEL